MKSKHIMNAFIVLLFASCIFADNGTTTTVDPTTATKQTTIIKTTEAPTPTTEAPAPIPTTDAPPTAEPPLTTPTFVVKDKDGKVCIKLQAYITLYVDNKTKADNISSNAIVTKNSTCGNTSETIEISNNEASLKFTFKKNKNEFSVDEISLSYKNLTFKSNMTEYRAGISHSYECNSVFNITLNGKDQEAILSTRKLRVQGFMESEGEKDDPAFGDSQQCPLDTETDGYVPIAVGTALAALVVIVLIAYFISRARSRRGLYHS